MFFTVGLGLFIAFIIAVDGLLKKEDKRNPVFIIDGAV